MDRVVLEVVVVRVVQRGYILSVAMAVPVATVVMAEMAELADWETRVVTAGLPRAAVSTLPVGASPRRIPQPMRTSPRDRQVVWVAWVDKEAMRGLRAGVEAGVPALLLGVMVLPVRQVDTVRGVSAERVAMADLAAEVVYSSRAGRLS